MPRSTVTGTKGAEALLRSRGHRGVDVKDAVATGLLHAEKVEGVWAYGVDEASVGDARAAVARAVEAVCGEWLLVPTPIAASGARKRLRSTDVDHSIAQALIRELIRTQRVGALPLLTEDYLPYFALYSPDDHDEIDRYLATLWSWAADGGEYHPDDLPKPIRPRAIEAWRERVLAHGEFLGLGRYEARSYVAHRIAR